VNQQACRMAPRPLRVLTVDLPPGSVLPPSTSMPKSPLMQPGFPTSPGLGVYGNQPSPRYNQPSSRYSQPASNLTEHTGGFSQPGSPFGRSQYSMPSPFPPASPVPNPFSSDLDSILNDIPPQKRKELAGLLRMILPYLENPEIGGFRSMPQKQHQLYQDAYGPRKTLEQYSDA
jgi:hypothetical protein